MGRKKLEMKRIEDKSSRQVSFTKRRGGLIKKARELSVLCDADVALLVFSARGKLYDFDFSSRPSSVDQILQRYQSHCEAEETSSTGGPKVESRFAGFMKSSELIEIVQRQLEEPLVDQLSVNDLVLLENQIDTVLVQIKCRQTKLMLDSITTLHEKEKLLKEENERLRYELEATGIDRRNASGVLVQDLNRKSNHHTRSCSLKPLLHLL